jgi:hypothetical protein
MGRGGAGPWACGAIIFENIRGLTCRQSHRPPAAQGRVGKMGGDVGLRFRTRVKAVIGKPYRHGGKDRIRNTVVAAEP